VPAVDGAVVETQSAQLRRLAPGEDLEGILVVLEPNQGAEAGNVLLVELRDGLLHPYPSEAHARRLFAKVIAGAPRVDRLLEERDARLAPQAVAAEHRRVRRGRHDPGGGRLRDGLEGGRG